MPVDRLTVLDTSLLEMETAVHHVHLGGLGVFEPGLEYGHVVRVLRERLNDIPLARKRVHQPPRGAGRPVWVDDPYFDLSFHVRHAALPAPGTRPQLAEFLARLMSRPLDRARPLWEIYLIDGLEDDRVGLFRKVHLAMAHAGGGDPFAILLDEEPRTLEAETGRFPGAWHPEPPPSPVALYADAVQDRAGRAGEAAKALLGTAIDPRRAVRAGVGLASSTLGLAARLRRPPASPLNRRLSAHRRFATVRCDLEDLRAVRRAFGGTINDVIVAVLGDAVGRLLRWRGHDTKDLDLTVMVPVRVHDREGEHTGFGDPAIVGDDVVGVIAPLPVMEMDPVARLYRIMGEMAGLKESRQAVAADQLTRLAGYAPAALHAMAAGVAMAEHSYNVALSNAPGPQTPRHLCGSRLEETYPFIPLAGDSALSVAVSSYAGGLFVGLLGDRDALFDLDVLAGFVRESVQALRDAAEHVTSGGESA